MCHQALQYKGMVFSMFLGKQFLTQRFLIALGLSSLCVGLSQASAEELNFYQEQILRLKELSSSDSSVDTTVKKADQNLLKVKALLKNEYDKQAGPHQQGIVSQIAAEKVKREFLNILEEAASGSEVGYDLTSAVNAKLKEKFGLKLDLESDKFSLSFAGSNDQERNENKKKFDDAVGSSVSSKWNFFSDNEKKTNVIPNVFRGLKDEVSKLDHESGKVSSNTTKKLQESLNKIGNEKSGRISELEKTLSNAMLDDQTEKRLLLAEVKAYESIKDKKTAINVDDLCMSFFANDQLKEDGSLKEVDLNKRRLALTGKDDPCEKPLAALTTPSREAKDLRRLSNVPDTGNPPGEGSAPKTPQNNSSGNSGLTNSPESHLGGSSGVTNSPGSQLGGGAKIDEKDLSSIANEDLKNKVKNVLDENNRLKDSFNSKYKQDLINACNQAANLKKSIGLGSDNEKNEKIVSSIADKLEKTLAKGYQGLVCEKSGANDGFATNASMEDASKDILKGLGIPLNGPLTQSKQNTLESLSKGAMEAAANFASQRRNRTRLEYQMIEAASKKALSRITTENPNLMDVNTLNYLRSLSYNELSVGVEGGLLANFLPPYAFQAYQNYYEIALMDIKEKSGIREEFDKQAECAFVFAQVASQRHSEEEDRKALLNSRVRGSATGLPVNNGTTVRNEDSNRKVERNR